jgi:hypothetical protein
LADIFHAIREAAEGPDFQNQAGMADHGEKAAVVKRLTDLNRKPPSYNPAI